MVKIPCVCASWMQLRSGGADVLQWGPSDSAASLQQLLATVHHLLKPSYGESEGVMAGHVVYEMLMAMPQNIGPFLPQVRLHSAGSPPKEFVPGCKHTAQSGRAQVHNH